MVHSRVTWQIRARSSELHVSTGRSRLVEPATATACPDCQPRAPRPSAQKVRRGQPVPVPVPAACDGDTRRPHTTLSAECVTASAVAIAELAAAAGSGRRARRTEERTMARRRRALALHTYAMDPGTRQRRRPQEAAPLIRCCIALLHLVRSSGHARNS